MGTSRIYRLNPAPDLEETPVFPKERVRTPVSRMVRRAASRPESEGEIEAQRLAYGLPDEARPKPSR